MAYGDIQNNLREAAVPRSSAMLVSGASIASVEGVARNDRATLM